MLSPISHNFSPDPENRVKLVIQTDFMRRSGDKGAIPVMSRTGKVTILQDAAFLDKPRLPEKK
jgi:hypothetical protein